MSWLSRRTEQVGSRGGEDKSKWVFRRNSARGHGGFVTIDFGGFVEVIGLTEIFVGTV